MKITKQKNLTVDQKSLLYSLLIGLGVIFLIFLVVLLFQTRNSQTIDKRVMRKPQIPTISITPKDTISSIIISPIEAPEDLALWKTIEDTPMVFQGKGGITYLKNLHSAPVVVGEGEKPVLSPDKHKIAYLPLSITADNPGNIVVVYDLQTQKEIQYKTDSRQVPPTITRILWSPDSKFHLLNFSGSPDNSQTAVYSFPDGKELITFNSNPTAYKEWLSSNQIVFQQGQTVSDYRPWGAGLGQSIVSLNVLTGEQQILAETDDFVDYRLIDMNNNQLYFSQNKVKSNRRLGNK